MPQCCLIRWQLLLHSVGDKQYKLSFGRIMLLPGRIVLCPWHLFVTFGKCGIPWTVSASLQFVSPLSDNPLSSIYLCVVLSSSKVTSWRITLIQYLTHLSRFFFFFFLTKITSHSEVLCENEFGGILQLPTRLAVPRLFCLFVCLCFPREMTWMMPESRNSPSMKLQRNISLSSFFFLMIFWHGELIWFCMHF